MKSVMYEGFIHLCITLYWSQRKRLFFKGENFWCALFESQGGRKKGKRESRDENRIIYLTTVLEAERNLSDVYKGEIMTVV
jgi:hypothetical protein